MGTTLRRMNPADLAAKNMTEAGMKMLFCSYLKQIDWESEKEIHLQKNSYKYADLVLKCKTDKRELTAIVEFKNCQINYVGYGNLPDPSPTATSGRPYRGKLRKKLNLIESWNLDEILNANYMKQPEDIHKVIREIDEAWIQVSEYNKRLKCDECFVICFVGNRIVLASEKADYVLVEPTKAPPLPDKPEPAEKGDEDSL